ncbi:MAG: glycosyltransferase family 39 protein [Candidatus Diapherotrites archaeon]|uniref:Glycosyltransferase family 39 protein n=1 Tax=Candidatus Iainarchaeum sp. TaxID=3101447 RepID=A0A8T3YMK1_9ARCH|nr:glycosyltransferase family 39 protein [Candidatus Diapherotrites archaeon]
MTGNAYSRERGAGGGFFSAIVHGRQFLALALLLYFALTIFTNQVVLRDYQASADEYDYLLSARMFATGRLSVPSPPESSFFNFAHAINDGRFYGKYPPGWPFFLMFGVLAGIPMAVNLLFGAMAICITYLIARDFFSVAVGRVAALLMATSPFVIMYSASYYSQPAALLLTALATYLYLKRPESESPLYMCALGLVIGVLFDTRPFDGAIVAALFSAHRIFVSMKSGGLPRAARAVSFACIGFLLGASAMLAYDYAQTGDPFLMPFQKYDHFDRPGFDTGSPYLGKSIWWAVENNIIKNVIDLNLWIPLCFLFIALSLVLGRNDSWPRALMLLVLLSFIAGYFFYAAPLFNSFGPRYFYPASFAVFILAADALCRLAKFQKVGMALLAAFLVLNLGVLFIYSGFWNSKVLAMSEPFRQASEVGLKDALVFLEPAPGSPYSSGDAPSWDLTRNGIDFNQGVLYASSKGNMNVLLMRAYPDREFYLWKCESILLEYHAFFDFWAASNVGCGFSRISPQYYGESQD